MSSLKQNKMLTVRICDTTYFVNSVLGSGNPMASGLICLKEACTTRIVSHNPEILRIWNVIFKKSNCKSNPYECFDPRLTKRHNLFTLLTFLLWIMVNWSSNGLAWLKIISANTNKVCSYVPSENNWAFVYHIWCALCVLVNV